MSALCIPPGLQIQSIEMVTASNAKKTVADLTALLITPASGRVPTHVILQATTGAFRFNAPAGGQGTDPVDGSVGIRLAAANTDHVLLERQHLQGLEFIRDGGADSIIAVIYLV